MNSTLTKNEPAAPSTTNGTQNRPQHLTPLANIAETEHGYLLEAEMPGVTKEGLEITVDNGELVIVGRRGEPKVKGQPVYRESRWWDYRRSFELDPSIDTGNISARMENGVLRLTLPKAESVKPRKIAVTD
jgi:HSP20 family protein